MGQKSKSYEIINPDKKILIEIPHGGYYTPEEVKRLKRNSLTPGQIREDSDEYCGGFYHNLRDDITVFRFLYWRAFLDANRKNDDFSPDGIVKTLTSQGVQIYNDPKGAPEEVRNAMVEKYIVSYKKKLSELIKKRNTERVVFCHTMPGIGTNTAPDSGQLRPLFMLGNGGGQNGEPIHPHSASTELLEHLSGIINTAISEIDLQTDFNYQENVWVDRPYGGNNSLRELDPAIFKGKHPFLIEVNRDIAIDNPDNIQKVREILRQVFQAHLDWSS